MDADIAPGWQKALWALLPIAVILFFTWFGAWVIGP